MFKFTKKIANLNIQSNDDSDTLVFSILGDEGMGKTKLDYAMKVHMQRIVRGREKTILLSRFFRI